MSAHGTNTSAPSWEPRYTLTSAIARALMEVEAARAVVEHTPLPAMVQEELRRRARPGLLVIGRISAIHRQDIGN